MPKKKTTKKVVKPKSKSMCQLDIAREIAAKVGRKFTLAEIQEILSIEKDVIMKGLKANKRIIMNNYLSLSTKIIKSREWKSPLDGIIRKLPERKQVCIRVGGGFKDFVNGIKK